MEKTDINRYHGGKIYKIVDNAYTECYFGSTIQPLYKRWMEHKRGFVSGKKLYSTSILFNKYGIENCKIELVEAYKCENKEELNKKEGEYIKKNVCVNKNRAGEQMTQKECYEKYKGKKKEYQEANKEHIKQYHKEYREENKDKIKQKEKEYYEANKEQKKQKAKEYREANKKKNN